MWTLRTLLGLTPVRTVIYATFRIINGAGRVSEFVYFSYFIFFFKCRQLVCTPCKPGIWHFDKVYIMNLIIIIITADDQRLGSADDYNQGSKRFFSNAVLS